MDQERMAEVDITSGARGMADRSLGTCFHHRRTRRSHVEPLVAGPGQNTAGVGVGTDTYAGRCVVGADVGEEEERE